MIKSTFCVAVFSKVTSLGRLGKVSPSPRPQSKAVKDNISYLWEKFDD